MQWVREQCAVIVSLWVFVKALKIYVCISYFVMLAVTHRHQQHRRRNGISPDGRGTHPAAQEGDPLGPDDHLNKINVENDSGQCCGVGGVGEIVTGPGPDFPTVRV